VFNSFAVTGGLGFLGQYISYEIIKKYPQAHVRILAKSERPVIIPELLTKENVEITFNNDLQNVELFADRLRDVDVVIHTAALVSFHKHHKSELLRINTEGTRRIIEMIASQNVKKLIHISSVAALGCTNDSQVLADEDFTYNWGHDHRNIYGYSKYLAELEVLKKVNEGMNAVIVNPASIYGPGDTKTRALFKSVIDGSLPFVMPGGLSVVDVRDVASAVLLAAEKGSSGRRYIAASTNISHKEFFNKVAGELGVKPPKRVLSPLLRGAILPIIKSAESLLKHKIPLTEQMLMSGFEYRYYSSDRARRELGWVPSYTLEQTLIDTIRYIKDHE
jgi:nucleoside-diphosphate-sugar epimerase